ncbi:MAG: polysaccharide deacetylase family protein [Chloroflexota bacterium]
MQDKTLSRRTFLKMIGASTLALGIAPTMVKAQGEPLRGLICPIMMYHYISATPEDAPRTLRDLTVLPENFVQQLDSIRERGYTTITMRDMWAGMQGTIPLPEKPIVLTFDDGYWDAFAHAAPALLERGMTGTFYLVSSFMEQPGYLTWEQARIMHSQGLEIGGHSATHGDMSRQTRETQEEEIISSTSAIEAQIGVRPVSFCYPFGRQTYITREILTEQGYQTAVTTAYATYHTPRTPYRLGRVRIRHTTTLTQFSAILDALH